MADDTTGYGRLIDPIWETINIYDSVQEFLATYKQAGEPGAPLYAAHFTQSEVRNGGFSQLFWNSTGVLAPEAVSGFRLIGMTQAAMVASAIALFGKSYPRDREERQKVLEGIDEKLLDAMDWKFYKLLDEENGGFESAADAFAEKIVS